jgi:hypothetical protein
VSRGRGLGGKAILGAFWAIIQKSLRELCFNKLSQFPVLGRAFLSGPQAKLFRPSEHVSIALKSRFVSIFQRDGLASE